MTAKITLITPPDIFENSNVALAFFNPSEEDQDISSEWLSANLKDIDLNLYYYQGEPEVPWLLHAIGVSKSIYFNCDKTPDVSTILMAYILSKPNVYYKTTNPHIQAIAQYFNQRSVNSISEFLEKVLHDQRKESSL